MNVPRNTLSHRQQSQADDPMPNLAQALEDSIHTQENFRRDFPAHIGYSVEEIQNSASHFNDGTQLTEGEIFTVCHDFNRADHSQTGELLDDIIIEIIKERDRA
jgi:hypothetical protein